MVRHHWKSQQVRQAKTRRKVLLARIRSVAAVFVLVAALLTLAGGSIAAAVQCSAATAGNPAGAAVMQATGEQVGDIGLPPALWATPQAKVLGMAYAGMFVVTAMAMTVNRPQRGAIYARHSTGEQKSVPDQIRECKEWAAANNVSVADAMIFTDLGKTGRTHKRPGLDKLIAAIDADQVDVVIVLQTSRLYRKLYQLLKFMAEKIIDKRKRIVFVTQNIDTGKDDRWRYLLPVLGMIDELRATMSNANVQAAHKGLHRQKRVWGTRTYGYRGKAVEGALTKKGRPTEEWDIDGAEADWVKKVFHWFVMDEVSIDEIARRLNQHNAPLSPKCVTGRWGRQAVGLMLRNPRYRGQWPYGAKETVWQNGAGYGRQISREEPLGMESFEELRLISDDLWFKAQEKLNEFQRGQAGRRPKDPRKVSRSRVMNKLYVCENPEHRRGLWAGGKNGSKMFCPDCRHDPEPTLFSLLPRDFAEVKTFETVGELIRNDDGPLIDQTIEACQRYAADLQQPDPAELNRLKKEEQRLTSHIRFIKDAPGETEQDMAENAARLAQLQRQRAEVRTKKEMMDKQMGKPFEVPSATEVRQMLDNIAEILLDAASSTDPALRATAGRIVKAVTGGRIVLSQQGERRNKCGWLRGTFRVNLLQPVLNDLNVPAVRDSEGIEVHVDYRVPAPSEAIADEAKELADKGLLMKEIAEELSRRHGTTFGRNYVYAALKGWHESRGLKMIDGRTRRSSLPVHSLVPPEYRKHMPRIMQLYKAGWLMQDIAAEVKLDRNTVTRAVKEWHKEHNLPVPDGRARRKTL